MKVKDIGCEKKVVRVTWMNEWMNEWMNNKWMNESFNYPREKIDENRAKNRSNPN